MRKTYSRKRCSFKNKKNIKSTQQKTKIHINLDARLNVAYVHNFPYLKLEVTNKRRL